MKDPIHFLRQQFPPTSDEAWEAVLTKDLKGADWREVLRWSSEEGFDLLPFYRYQKRVDGRTNSQTSHDDQNKHYGRANHNDQTDHNDQTSHCEWVDEIHPADPLARWFSRYEFEAGSDTVPIFDSLPTEDCIEIDATAYHEAGATLVQELAATLGALNEILLRIADTGASPTGSPNPTSSPKADHENEHSPQHPIIIYLSAGSLYFPEIAKFQACRTLVHGLLALHFPDTPSAQPSSPHLSSPHTASPHTASPHTASTHPSTTPPAPSLSPPIILHAVTSTRNKSRKDIHDNLIRLTTESMAAILGGADRITIHPPDFIETRDTNGTPDSSSPDSSSSSSSSLSSSSSSPPASPPASPPSSFSRRMARNIHHLLTLESHLSNVSNPTAGCYYLEELHDQLARKAWEQFQEWERQGGFLHGLMQGHVSREIRQARTNRLKDLAEGKTQRIDTETYLEEQR
jgi:methylmalonyl-CoA mutase